jgi:hypothetical protein
VLDAKGTTALKKSVPVSEKNRETEAIEGNSPA